MTPKNCLLIKNSWRSGQVVENSTTILLRLRVVWTSAKHRSSTGAAGCSLWARSRTDRARLHLNQIRPLTRTHSLRGGS